MGIKCDNSVKIYKCAWYIVKDPKGDVPNGSYLYTQWQVLAHVDTKKNGWPHRLSIGDYLFGSEVNLKLYETVIKDKGLRRKGAGQPGVVENQVLAHQRSAFKS